MIFLSPKQKILLEIAKEKGFITLQDANAIYSTNQEKQLKRLMALGFLEVDSEHIGRLKLREGARW